MNDTRHVKGLSELSVFMNSLAPKLQNNVMRAALRAGAKVVKDAAMSNVPVAAPSRKGARVYGGYAGALRDSLRYGARIDRRSGNVIAYVRAGGKARTSRADTFYAHMVEYGTSPHSNGSFMHPGATPRPFLRPALDTQSQQALRVIANYIKNRLDTRYGLDTRDIATGDDE